MMAQSSRSAHLCAWQSVLPDPTSTALLRSCLAEPDDADRAWQQFVELTDNPRAFFESNFHGLKGLLAFVAFSLEQNRVNASPEFMTYARVALLREELRSRIYYDVLGEACEAFESNKIPFSLLRGAAIATRLFPSPYIRHNHAIDFLVVPKNLPEIRSIMLGGEFKPDLKQPHVLVHSSGLPLVLHTCPVDHPYGLTINEHVQVTQVEGREVQVLCDTENLFVTIANAAFSPGHKNLRWLVDACLTIRQCHIDWQALSAYAEGAGLGLFFAYALEYLNRHLHTNVPVSVVATLRETAMHQPDIDRVLFSSLLMTLSSHARVWKALVHHPAAQMKFLLFAILPPVSFVLWRQRSTDPMQVVRWHLSRPFRVLFRLLGRHKRVAR